MNSEQTVKAYTYDEVDAAMCLWEEVLGRVEHGINGKGFPEGAAHARYNCIDLGASMERAYLALDGAETYGDPFDWEFVPALYNRLDDIVGDPLNITDAERDSIVLGAAKWVIAQHEAESKDYPQSVDAAMRELEMGWRRAASDKCVYGYDTTRPDCPICDCPVEMPDDADGLSPWTAACVNGHEHTFEVIEEARENMVEMLVNRVAELEELCRDHGVNP